MAKVVTVSESRFPILPRVPVNQFYSSYYNQPTFYGTCTAVTGSGIVSNNCLPGSTPVATSGNGCYCYDPATQWAGCGNTANGVCRLPTNPFASNIVVSQPVSATTFPVYVPEFTPWSWRRRAVPLTPQRWDHGLHPCGPGMLC